MPLQHTRGQGESLVPPYDRAAVFVSQGPWQKSSASLYSRQRLCLARNARDALLRVMCRHTTAQRVGGAPLLTLPPKFEAVTLLELVGRCRQSDKISHIDNVILHIDT